MRERRRASQSCGSPLFFCIEKRERENHKYDEIRADQDLSWCPTCGCKWEIFEGKLWFSADEPLWKMSICPDCTAE